MPKLSYTYTRTRSKWTMYLHKDACLVHRSRTNRDKLLGEDNDGRRNVVSDETFRENNAVLAVTSEGSALKVKAVDLLKKKNRTAHHTDEYEQEDLIVRRGEEFYLALTFDRDVSVEDDVLVVQFACGARPQESKGSLHRVRLNLKDWKRKDLGWNGEVKEVKGDTVTVGITSEPDCMIGRYEIFVETRLVKGEKDFTRYECNEKLIMLFNPWCPDDAVYMENADERHEYVLNDTGRIWIGSAWRNYGRPWNFGQFERPVLDVTLGLLDKGELVDNARGSVSSVVRCLSALTNSSDDSGVLMGRWTKTYPEDSTKPWEWTGSVAIVEEYQKTGKPVRYGQCWVFSGVATTLMRSLGIPTRSVTNFQSAHDCDCSMTIDSHYDTNDAPLKNLDDSVWNFHVWNESFFRRNDLPPGYDGWQVHDATPQEASEGVMRCGPAPLKAVKEGHVYLNFDVGFVFAEVNGDRVDWTVFKDGSMEVKNIQRHAVGKNISTKAVGWPWRNDLTDDYKYAEGSPEERKVVEFVNRFSTEKRKNIYKKDKPKEITLKTILPEDKMVGEDFKVGVKVTNTSKLGRALKVTLTLASTFYTGVVGTTLKTQSHEVVVEENKETDVMMDVDFNTYEKIMNPEVDFKLTATCRVKETDEMSVQVESFSLLKPSLDINVPKNIPYNKETIAKISLKNSTKLKLHGGVFRVEGSHFLKLKKEKTKKVIEPNEEVFINVPILPTYTRSFEVVATFSSDRISVVESVDLRSVAN